MADISHWYDGAFYDRCIAPNQDPLFAAIMKHIPRGSAVLDVGCGTGRLAFKLAGSCRQVHGIDPSSRNIRTAHARWERAGRPATVRFIRASAFEIPEKPDGPYDIAVLSYVIHEVDAGSRRNLLHAVSRHARTLILGDYRVPRVRGLYDALTEAVEFFAGRSHYRGFRSFVREGGLLPLVERAGLTVVKEEPSAPENAQVLVVS